MRMAVGRGVRRLPWSERQAFVRCDLWSWSVSETATRMEVSKSAVGVYRWRAKAKLRELLKDESFAGC